MIGSLRGTVRSVSAGQLLLDCGGVGFLIQATPAALAAARINEPYEVLTTLAVKEDALTLYGFVNQSERDAFTAVQTVSGIGPRIALAILAQLTPVQLATAVANGDTAVLQRVPGIGRKGAQRLVLELAGKLVGLDGASDAATGRSQAGATNEVVTALTGLGWSEAQANDAIGIVEAAGGPSDVPGLLRAALRQLGGRA